MCLLNMEGVRLLIFIDSQVLLDILRKWGTHNFYPRPKEVVHFDLQVIYPLLLELRQWFGDLVLMKIKSHHDTGCLLNERADKYADLGRTAEGPELCPGPQKYGSLWLLPIVRDYAQQSRKSLLRDSAPNKSRIDKVTAVNTYRAVHKRRTTFVKDLLHSS